MTALWTLMQFAAGLVILWESIVRLNAMTPATRISVSLSWIALGASSAVVGYGATFGDITPDWRAAALMTSMAAFSVIDRRRKG